VTIANRSLDTQSHAANAAIRGVLADPPRPAFLQDSNGC
jgi:hypothetical protein